MDQYHLLRDDHKHKHLANYLLAQETDHYLHSINKDRYVYILQNLPPGSFRDRIQKLHDETCERLAEVDAIIKAVHASSPPIEEMKKALVLIEEKQAVRGH